MPEAERHRQAERVAAALDFDPFNVVDTIEQHVPYSAELVGPLQMPRRPQLRSSVLTVAAVDGEEHAAPANAATATRDALNTAMARLERTVRKLDPTDGTSPAVPDTRTSRDDDRRDTRTDHGPTIGM
jgi:hypothetical protein